MIQENIEEIHSKSWGKNKIIRFLTNQAELDSRINKREILS